MSEKARIINHILEHSDDAVVKFGRDIHFTKPFEISSELESTRAVFECPTILGYPIIKQVKGPIKSYMERIRDAILEQIDDLHENELIVEEDDDRVVILFDRDISIDQLRDISTYVPEKAYLECPILKVQKDEEGTSDQSDV